MLIYYAISWYFGYSMLCLASFPAPLEKVDFFEGGRARGYAMSWSIIDSKTVLNLIIRNDEVANDICIESSGVHQSIKLYAIDITT